MKPARIVRLTAVMVVVAGLAGVALVAQQTQPKAAKMAAAATTLVGSLTAEQKSKATFAFDDPHRTKWYFTPQQDKTRNSTRKGLRYDHMTDVQRKTVHELLKEGLSQSGYGQAITIMGLETLLAELEGGKGAMVRNPQWYFVSIFGEPSNTGAWGWRFEGHHLSVNFTLDKGEVVSATPLLFAANPAEVRTGFQKGLRTLPEAEDAAQRLIASLTADQKKTAKRAEQFSEIKEGQPDAAVGPPVGLPAAKLSADQKKTLRALYEGYAHRLPAEVAQRELQKVADAGEEKVHFAYCIEEQKPGKPYSYRVQGPTFVVEFLNVQADSSKNPANHIHSAWRRLPIDFGLTLGN